MTISCKKVRELLSDYCDRLTNIDRKFSKTEGMTATGAREHVSTVVTPAGFTCSVKYVQARPDVFFELGWFHGRLCRNRFCIFFKKRTQIHSDLVGVSCTEFSESVTEKVPEIEKELKAAGLLVTKGVR